MTAATAGILVEEGKLEWSTRIASILPPSLKVHSMAAAL